MLSELSDEPAADDENSAAFLSRISMLQLPAWELVPFSPGDVEVFPETCSLLGTIYAGLWRSKTNQTLSGALDDLREGGVLLVPDEFLPGAGRWMALKLITGDVGTEVLSWSRAMASPGLVMGTNRRSETLLAARFTGFFK